MQVRTVAYHDLDTSRLHNLRFVNIVRPGVYRGYTVRVNPANPSLLDITFGTDETSVLVTAEGVRVQETEELMGVLRVSPADSSFARWDLVVAEYRWSPDNSIQQAYKIIKGQYQRSFSVEPVRPQPQNQYQVPLAWVYVQPRTAVGGVATVSLSQDDVIHAVRGSGFLSDEVATLRPIPDPTNRKRVFVFEGMFPNLDGTEIIRFEGGYSEEIDDSAMSDGETRYFLFGISDDGDVGVAGQSANPSVSPEIGSNILPLCIAKAVKRSGTTTIDEITDIRFPFSRRVAPQPEEDFYQDLLGDSVFKRSRIDTFDPGTLIDLMTLFPSETGLTAKVDYGDTSLAITWSGSGEPSDDVRISTKNILLDTPWSEIAHIMVMVEADVDVTYDYSTASGTGGFTGQDLRTGTIQEIAGGASSLYIRFKIPKSAFAGGGTVKVYNYAVFLSIDPGTLNENVMTGLGLDTVAYSVPNLICNGGFRVWSRVDAKGDFPDIDARDKIDYPIEVGSEDKIFAADGWQFTRLDFAPDSGVISRILWSRDVVGSLDETTIDPALEWKGAAGDQGALNHLEFRVLSVSNLEGQFVTFSFDYVAQPKEAVGIRLVLYEKQADGTLAAYDTVESGPIRADGNLLVRSGVQISDRTYAIGFVIVFQRTTGVSTVYVRRARAAIGDFRVLPFTEARNAADVCRQYYERGSVYASSRLSDGDEVGTASQYGSRKLLGLCKDGEVRIRQIQESRMNRSVNVSSLEFTGDDNGFIAKGTSSGGLSVVDLDWEAEVVYP